MEESLALHPRVTRGCYLECHFFDRHWFTGWEGYHNMMCVCSCSLSSYNKILHGLYFFLKFDFRHNDRLQAIPRNVILMEKTPAYFHTLGVPRAIAAVGGGIEKGSGVIYSFCSLSHCRWGPKSSLCCATLPWGSSQMPCFWTITETPWRWGRCWTAKGEWIKMQNMWCQVCHAKSA